MYLCVGLLVKAACFLAQYAISRKPWHSFIMSENVVLRCYCRRRLVYGVAVHAINYESKSKILTFNKHWRDLSTRSGADSIGHGARAPTFTNGWAWGHRE